MTTFEGNIRTGDWLPVIEFPVDNTTAYADGDLLANPIEVEDFVKGSGVTLVASVVALDYDDQGQNLAVLFFGSDPGALGVLNAAMAINDGQFAKCQGSITVDSWEDLGDQQVGTETSTTLAVRPTDGGTSIWVALKSQGTGTYASGNIGLLLGLLRG
jgi:hypothetical protein